MGDAGGCRGARAYRGTRDPRKILEDSGSVELLGVYSPPDLPLSPDLPPKDALKYEQVIDYAKMGMLGMLGMLGH